MRRNDTDMTARTEASRDEPDSVETRLRRLLALFRVPAEGDGPPYWVTLGAHLTANLGAGKKLNDAELILSSPLLNSGTVKTTPSAHEVDVVLRYIGESEHYFDLTQPRFKSEARLLLAQLDKMGVSAFRMCRAYMREFDRVAALEILVDVTSSVAPRAHEIGPER